MWPWMGGGGCAVHGAASQVPRTPSADHLRRKESGERGSEGEKEEEREGSNVPKTKTQKPEATSHPARHSDPTQVARPRRSQIVLCDTRAIQQEQDAVCRMSQTPRRCIVVCFFLCICVHVWLSVDFRERLWRDDLAPLSVKCLTVNERIIDKLN